MFPVVIKERKVTHALQYFTLFPKTKKKEKQIVTTRLLLWVQLFKTYDVKISVNISNICANIFC